MTQTEAEAFVRAARERGDANAREKLSIVRAKNAEAERRRFAQSCMYEPGVRRR